ncbi:hypothetical protein ACFWAT_20675 [Streptomyces syringium]|uniref:hypothetical protein n=1 Tax=Streptomyces syringium TaxID=76729 RepID=UPI00364EC566
MNKIHMVRVMAATACAAALIGVTACGSESGGKGDGKSGLDAMSAQQISDKAMQALRDAKSLRFKQDGFTQGQPVKMNLILDRQGSCAGQAGGAKGGSTDVIKLGDKVWMKPDHATWEEQIGAAKAATIEGVTKGRYIHGPTSDPLLAGMANTCDLTKFQAAIKGGDASGEDMAKGKPATVEGKKVIPLESKSGKGEATTVYVASEGTPYPVKIVQNEGGRTTTTIITDYDKPVPTATPSPAETIDIAQLRKQLQGA